MRRRLDHLVRFYDILATLERRIGGRRLLAECRGRMDWPLRGIYFFMEEGERRTDTGTGLRIVRVGTHALKAGSRTTLSLVEGHRSILPTWFPCRDSHSGKDRADDPSLLRDESVNTNSTQDSLGGDETLDIFQSGFLARLQSRAVLQPQTLSKKP